MAETTQTATPERLAKVRGRVLHSIVDGNRRQAADRIVPVFELMFRCGQIAHAERDAGETYARYMAGARRVPGLVSSYGSQRWEGTTASQANDAMGPDDWRVHCIRRLAEANAAIGDDRLRRTLERVVEADATLELIGKEFLGAKSRQQNRSSGATLVKQALERLARRYGSGR